MWDRAPSRTIQSLRESFSKWYNISAWRKKLFWILPDGNLWFYPLPALCDHCWCLVAPGRFYCFSNILWDGGPNYHCNEFLLSELNIKGKNCFLPQIKAPSLGLWNSSGCAWPGVEHGSDPRQQKQCPGETAENPVTNFLCGFHLFNKRELGLLFNFHRDLLLFLLTSFLLNRYKRIFITYV